MLTLSETLKIKRHKSVVICRKCLDRAQAFGEYVLPPGEFTQKPCW